MRRFIPTGLRAQISSVVAAPAIGMAVLAALASLWLMQKISGEMSLESLHQAAQRTEMTLQMSEQAMQTVAMALTGDSVLTAAIAAGNTSGLGAHLLQLRDQLAESDPRIVVLEVGDSRGRVLFRAHEPQRAGDDKSQVPDIREALAGRMSTGVVVARSTGHLSYGTTLPLRHQGQVVGTLRVAGLLDDSTASVFAALSGGETTLVRSGVPLGGTLRGLTPDILTELLRDGGPARTPNGTTVEISGDGRYLMRTLPLTDIDSQQVGAIILGLPLRPWQAAQRQGALAMLAVAVLGLLTAIPLALLLAGRLASAIKQIASAMSGVAAGNLQQAVPGLGRRDEVGAMAATLEILRDGLVQARQLRQAADVAQQQRNLQVAAIDGYTRDFGQSISGVMTQLEYASKGMSQAAQQMSGAVGQTRGRASATASAAVEASDNLTAVAAAVEQMAASVSEISRQVARAAEVATEAVSEAQAADTRMQALTGSADRVGDILGVIADVAARTNLLALNATIEAARAGEAGKGFAVVASEVKQLAAQTARATEDVATQISAMRSAADQAAGAMGGMKRTIARIDEVATTIATAVEEQGASTREITQRLQGVATSTGGVSQAMGELLGLAEESGGVSSHVETAAAGLGAQAVSLRTEVEGFLNNLRSDVQERRSFTRREVSGHMAIVIIAGQEQRVPLLDISAGGAGLQYDDIVAPGTSLRVTLPGLPALDARVAQSQQGLLRMVFGQGHEALLDQALEKLCGETV